MKTSSTLFRTLPLLTALLGLVACTKSARVSTTAGGHAISATLEGNHSIDNDSERAVIGGEFGKITVESARVRLGDGPWTKIPEHVPISLGISRHKRWVTAAGVSIKETSR